MALAVILSVAKDLDGSKRASPFAQILQSLSLHQDDTCANGDDGVSVALPQTNGRSRLGSDPNRSTCPSGSSIRIS